MSARWVPAGRLGAPPYSGMVGYPRASARQLRARLRCIESLGVTHVRFAGPVRLGTLCALGKGYASVVLEARAGRRRVALKIRRTDSPRSTMAAEARLLAAANAAGVGPRIRAHCRDAITMDLAAGLDISDWIESVRGRGSAARVRSVLRQVLGMCRALDRAGIDHGELVMLSKHVVVSDGDRAVMLDFESASTLRRTANVTSAAQALLVGASLSRRVRRACSLPDRDGVVSMLRAYKADRTDEGFAALLGGLGL